LFMSTVAACRSASRVSQLRAGILDGLLKFDIYKTIFFELHQKYFVEINTTG
jgi:hypothetical protein